MKTIDAEDFQQLYMSLIDQLDDEDVVITKHGKPVAKLTKYEGKSAHLIGSLKDKITIHGDIFSTGIHYPEDCHKFNRPIQP